MLSSATLRLSKLFLPLPPITIFFYLPSPNSFSLLFSLHPKYQLVPPNILHPFPILCPSTQKKKLSKKAKSKVVCLQEFNLSPRIHFWWGERVNQIRRLLAELTCSNLTCPDLTCLNLTCLDLTCPDLTCPNLACTNLACPNLTCPNLTCPNLTCPKVENFILGLKYSFKSSKNPRRVW